MRRCMLLACLCLALAACGGAGTVTTLPDDGKTALSLYIAGHFGGTPWEVQSAEQATKPDYYFNANFPDAIWCVVISPALVAPNDPQRLPQKHFLVDRSVDQWYVQQAPVPLPQSFFANLGCNNW